MHIAWRPQMSVDNGVIDDDHRQIIAIINEFLDIEEKSASAQECLQVLGKLDHYTKVHFKREVALQKSIGFRYIESHMGQHRDLLKRLDELRARTEANTAPENVVDIHRGVAEILRSWFIDHIIRSDLNMRPYAAALRKGAAGLEPLSNAAERATGNGAAAESLSK